jgi:hypothetical protein
VGGLLGLETARVYATKAANVARSEQGRSAASERRRLEAAEHVAEVLGQMKGVMPKLCMITVPGLEDGDWRLVHDRRRGVPFKDMQNVIERELGECTLGLRLAADAHDDPQDLEVPQPAAVLDRPADGRPRCRRCRLDRPDSARGAFGAKAVSARSALPGSAAAL